MNDKVLEFNNLRSKVEDMINHIKNEGFSTDEYTDALNEIIDDMKVLYNQNRFSHFVSIDFSNIMRRLRNLEKLLFSYNIFFKASNIADYIDEQLNSDYNMKNVVNRQEKDNISKIFNAEHIDDLVNKMIDILNQVRSLNKFSFDEDGKENQIIHGVYNTVYQLIKLEVFVKSNSKLFDFIKENNSDLALVDRLFKNDAENIDSTSYKSSMLSKKLFELNSKGFGDNYFDVESVKLLLNCDDKFKIEKGISLELNSLTEKVSDLGIQYKDNKIKLSDFIAKYSYFRNSLREYRKSVLKSILSFALSISIVGGIGYGIPKLAKKMSYSDCYKKTISTYSDYNGLNVSDGYVRADSISSKPNTIYLREYGVWEDGRSYKYQRDVKIYDVSDFSFDNIEDYISYGVENYSITYETEREKTDEAIRIYSEPYIEVEKTFVDTSNVEEVYNEDDNFLNNFGFYAIYVFILVAILLSSNFQFIFGNFGDIFDWLKECRDCKADKKKILAKMKNIILLIQEQLNNNEKLKLEFNRLYEENKFLLDNPEELYNRFNELTTKMTMPVQKVSNHKIKKLIKTKKNVEKQDIDW